MKKYLNLKLRHIKNFQYIYIFYFLFYFSMICFVTMINSFLVPKNFPSLRISIHMQLSKSSLQKEHNLVQQLLILKYQNLYQKLKLDIMTFQI
jgi:hypothetical protein